MSRIRVLVVEQDPAVREGVARLLEIAGFVVATSDPNHNRTSAFRPDVVLTDIAMPVNYESLVKQVWKQA